MEAIDGGDDDRLWRRVRDHLEDMKAPIDVEIRNYPPPIADCDAQFNYLIERRTEISRELGRLAGMRDDVEAFVATSAVIKGFRP